MSIGSLINIMLIVIISDIHDNLAYLEKFLAWASDNDIENIICCGDITNPDTMDVLANGFKGTIDLVDGNREIYTKEQIRKYANLRHQGRVGRVEIGGKFFGFCHEPFLIEKVLELGKIDMVFYGHTHKPWKEKKDGVDLVNPGTLGGVFQKATFASYDLENDKLKLHLMDYL
jgi:hypothetical protein